jgi:hypothetical protein
VNEIERVMVVGNSSRRIGPKKTTTFTTFTTNAALDSENDGSVLVVKNCEKGEKKRKPHSTASEVEISPVVVEFLRDGGKASRQRFLAEFPEAAG